MEEIGFKNVKCNILLYRYASNDTKKKQCKRYANLLMYCAVDKDGQLVDEKQVKDFLIHEHLLEETSERFLRTTEQGEHVLVNEILISEGKNRLNENMIMRITFLSLLVALSALIVSCITHFNNWNQIS
ncbi:hypothetical protein [Phocaeicola sp.]